MGNSLETGEFPAQMASNVENVSIWWGYHGKLPVQHYFAIMMIAENKWHTSGALSCVVSHKYYITLLIVDSMYQLCVQETMIKFL